jgi:hypothetical protein
MSLYLGNDKVKINLDGVRYCLNLISAKPSTDNVGLLSLDNYILKDLNGLLLIPKESE